MRPVDRGRVQLSGSISCRAGGGVMCFADDYWVIMCLWGSTCLMRAIQRSGLLASSHGLFRFFRGVPTGDHGSDAAAAGSCCFRGSANCQVNNLFLDFLLLPF